MEVRWPVHADDSMPMAGDPHLKILIGRFSDAVSKQFNGPEPLPAAALPDPLAAGNVQYRWKSKEEVGVLLQIGPGVLTVNHAEPSSYDWPPFRDTCERWLSMLVSLSKSQREVVPDRIMFRYINSIPFDFTKTNTFEFLRDHLHAEFAAPISILPADRVSTSPQTFQAQSSFMCTIPPGRITLVFAHVHLPEERLLWQILFESAGSDVPSIPNALFEWLEQAHSVIDSIFRNMIKGDLERRFA